MNRFIVALAVASATIATVPAFAADAPAAVLSVETSTIGDLLDNPGSKAVLEKHMPAMVSNPQIEMARGMTLKQIQGFAPDQVTDDVLAKVEADLKALKK
jgi:hypothetical protein